MTSLRPKRGRIEAGSLRQGGVQLASTSRDCLWYQSSLFSSGAMPPALACRFTLAEQAVLAVVAAEVARHGRCTLVIDHIAALAGVSRATVKRALREVQRLSLVRIEERRLSAWRNAPNVVTIVSSEWSAWLRMRRKGVGSILTFHAYRSLKKAGQRRGTGLGLPKGRESGGLRPGETRTVHRSKDGVEVMAAEPKSEAELIRALSEDLALEILASYTPEDFADADFTSLGEAALGEAAVYLAQHEPGVGPAPQDLIAKVQKAAGT